jgi:hypothetical protein
VDVLDNDLVASKTLLNVSVGCDGFNFKIVILRCLRNKMIVKSLGELFNPYFG